MTASILPAPSPSGIHSLRFYQTGTLTANFTDNQWLFTSTPVLFFEEVPNFVPAPNAVNLGPMTATLQHVPLNSSVALTINWNENAVAKTATLTSPSTIGGTNAANLSSASINVTTGVITLTFVTGHAPDAGSINVTYTKVSKQGWSKGIRITSTTSSSGYVEFSFDGVNVHGRVDYTIQPSVDFLDRYEGGISVRGTGNFRVEAW